MIQMERSEGKCEEVRSMESKIRNLALEYKSHSIKSPISGKNVDSCGRRSGSSLPNGDAGTPSGVSHRRASRISLATCDLVTEMSTNEGRGPSTHRYPSPTGNALNVTLRQTTKRSVLVLIMQCSWVNRTFLSWICKERQITLRYIPNDGKYHPL